MKRPKPFGVGSIRVRVAEGPREDGRWRWRADRAAGTVDGRERRETVWSGWGTRAEAEAAVLAELTRAGRRHEVAEGVETVRALLELWLPDAARDDRSERTTAARDGCAVRIARSALGDALLSALGYLQIEEYARSYPGATSTLGQDLRALRAAWTWGRRRGLVPDRDLPPYRIRHDGGRYSRYTPEPEEVALVLAELRARSEWAWRAAYLLWATGCRPDEVATLEWSGVRGRAIHVVGKTGPRRVPLRASVWAELASWERGRQAEPSRHPDDTGGLDTVVGVRPATVRSRLHDHLAAACERAGVPRWSPYGLRRAVVDRLYDASSDPSTAGAVLGHSESVAIRVYRTVRPRRAAAAVEAAALGEVLDLDAARRTFDGSCPDPVRGPDDEPDED